MRKKTFAVGIAVAALLLGGAAGASAAEATVPHVSYYAGLDPYATGCDYGAYIANTAALQDFSGDTVATVQNWYSPACNTNWGVMTWDNGNGYYGSWMEIASNDHWGDAGSNPYHQCWPDDCLSNYYGSAQPMWTSMIDGTATACIRAAHDTGDERWGLTPGPWSGSGGAGWAACA